IGIRSLPIAGHQEEGVAETGMVKEILWAQRDGLPKGCLRSVRVLHIQRYLAQKLPGVRVLWVEFGGPLRDDVGIGQAALLLHKFRQLLVREEVVGMDFNEGDQDVAGSLTSLGAESYLRPDEPE